MCWLESSQPEPGALCLVLDAGPTGPFGRAFVGNETHRLLVSGTLTHRGYLGCPLAGLITQGERQRGLRAKEGSLRDSPPPQLTLQGPCLEQPQSLLVSSGARSCPSLWGPLPGCTGLRIPHGLYLGCVRVFWVCLGSKQRCGLRPWSSCSKLSLLAPSGLLEGETFLWGLHASSR